MRVRKLFSTKSINDVMSVSKKQVVMFGYFDYQGCGFSSTKEQLGLCRLVLYHFFEHEPTTTAQIDVSCITWSFRRRTDFLVVLLLKSHVFYIADALAFSLYRIAQCVMSREVVLKVV